MKYCPVCDTRFDEEVIRFCTKDGTPLIEEAEPKFTEMPSENLGDDDVEVTQVRGSAGRDDPNEDLPPVVPRSERIIIPTAAPPVGEQAVRPRPQSYYPPPPPPPNTTKTVVLTVLGTLAVLGFGALLFWLLQGSEPANVNVNTNFNANLNTNLGIDSNFNFNVPPPNINTNLNTNFSFNSATPAPTATPTPRPTPSATPSPSPTAAATPTRTPAFNVRPGTPTPTPRQGPRPTASPGGREE